jgi:hypothetical protein
MMIELDSTTKRAKLSLRQQHVLDALACERSLLQHGGGVAGVNIGQPTSVPKVPSRTQPLVLN